MSSSNFPVPAFPCGERYAVRASKLFTMAKRRFMMEREQCGVRCHLRGFDTGFFCRNRLYRRSYNEKNERADAERQSEPERQHFDCAARDGKRIPRKRCRVRDRFAATGIFTAALRPENASLPTSRTSLSRNSRRRKHCLRSVRHSSRQGAVRSAGAGGMDADPLHPPR